MKNLTIALLCALIYTGCSTEPQEISYGFDPCEFCEMTIVDRSHAAILVSSKGKSYKFDAIECMVRYMNRSEKREYIHILTTDYLMPGEMIDARESHFLISDEIPSPMGANLSALRDEVEAGELENIHGGESLSWPEVVERFQ